MDRMAVKLEQDLTPMDEGNGEEQVKSRSMNQYVDTEFSSRAEDTRSKPEGSALWSCRSA